MIILWQYVVENDVGAARDETAKEKLTERRNKRKTSKDVKGRFVFNLLENILLCGLGHWGTKLFEVYLLAYMKTSGPVYNKHI